MLCTRAWLAEQQSHHLRLLPSSRRVHLPGPQHLASSSCARVRGLSFECSEEEIALVLQRRFDTVRELQRERAGQGSVRFSEPPPRHVPDSS